MFSIHIFSWIYIYIYTHVFGEAARSVFSELGGESLGAPEMRRQAFMHLEAAAPFLGLDPWRVVAGCPGP